MNLPIENVDNNPKLTYDSFPALMYKWTSHHSVYFLQKFKDKIVEIEKYHFDNIVSDCYLNLVDIKIITIKYLNACKLSNHISERDLYDWFHEWVGDISKISRLHKPTFDEIYFYIQNDIDNYKAVSINSQPVIYNNLNEKLDNLLEQNREILEKLKQKETYNTRNIPS